MKLFLVLVAITACVSSESAVQEFAAGNHKFTAQLYKEILKDQTGNFIVSPLSIEIILALTQAGARGATAQEFTSALSLPSTQEKTEEALKTFLPTLKNNQDDLKLLSANKLFLGKDFEVLQSFKQIATQIYDAEADNVNFGDPRAAAALINQWVEKHTNNKIQDLINPQILNDLTKMVLVNTLYFSGKWVIPFEKYQTRKQPFYTSAQVSKEVEMMHLEGTFRYYDDTARGVQFLELPYQGGNISMTIVLPKETEGLTAVEQNIESFLQDQPLQDVRVAVTLPKFLVESDINLTNILKRLGLNQAFQSTADFSGLSKVPVYISEVIQKAFINVTEAGTEAAAATAVSLVLLSAPVMFDPPQNFVANHPFLYFVKERATGTALFAGRVYY